jgi:hypothetical protein
VPRVNVWIPDELHHTIKSRVPRLNLSAIVQGALAATLECDHDELACATCSAGVERSGIADEAMGRLYDLALGKLERLMNDGGTVEGAIRLLAEAGRGLNVTAAQRAVPRLSKARRDALELRLEQQMVHAAKQRELHALEQRRRRGVPGPTPITAKADSKSRHPTARRTG